MNRPWVVELWQFLGLLLVGVLAGLAIGSVVWGLAIALGAYSLWHLSQLYRLFQWLNDLKNTTPPDARGIWGEVFASIRRLLQRDRKRKKKLTAMLNQFQRSSAALPDAIVIINRRGEIEWLNEAATRLLGLKLPNDVGKRITYLIRHPDFVSYLNAESYRLPLEFSSPIRNGIQLSARIVAYGKKQRLISIRDVTRLHRLESVRRDFIANVSHELRTPLTVITGYLEALADEVAGLDPAQGNMISVMQDQSERMRRLVDDLLMLSKLETTQIAADDETEVLVTALAEEILAASKALSGDGQHRLVFDVDDRLALRGSNKELHSAFSNLVSNAIRYSPEGGEIVIQWKGTDDGAVFSVRDNGMGIEAQHLPRLTERFYRINKDRSPISGGTGLGLAIVKHILQRHDATLQIESRIGQGSTFSCLFPLARVVRVQAPGRALKIIGR